MKGIDTGIIVSNVVVLSIPYLFIGQKIIDRISLNKYD